MSHLLRRSASLATVVSRFTRSTSRPSFHFTSLAVRSFHHTSFSLKENDEFKDNKKGTARKSKKLGVKELDSDRHPPFKVALPPQSKEDEGR
jgi:hypothetical protein